MILLKTQWRNLIIATYLRIYASTALLLDHGGFHFLLYFYSVGRTTWQGDQPVARPLPTHRAARTEKTQTDIHH
jgi:hypothetical protein